MTSSVALTGVALPRDGPYRTLPFDVPPGIAALTLRYRYDAGCILDLGLLDPRARAFPSRDGFRGWSGSARSEVQVGLSEATPGYLAGPLPPGRWHVLLGLACVPVDGCRYHIEVDLQGARLDEEQGMYVVPTVRPTATRGEAQALDGEGVARWAWYPGDLQTHTHHSDARGSLDDLLAAARARRLRYVAVTDHNTNSHHAPLRARSAPALIGVPGMEVTTYRGHANVWGARGWVDFRITRDADVDAMIARAHELDGLVSINHPKTQPGCVGCDWEWAVPAHIDALEAWQGPWPLRNWQSLARYDRLLRQGRRVTLVGGSDRHQPPLPEIDPPWLRVGSPTTWLLARGPTEANLLEAIAQGRATVSEHPGGPRLAIDADGLPTGSLLPPGRAGHRVRARVRGAGGELLRWVGASGVLREVPVVGARFEDVWCWCADGPYLRAEVVARTSLPRIVRQLEAYARSPGLPYGITPDEVLAHPFTRALSNPLYAHRANDP